MTANLPTVIAHLAASPCVGGPEAQLLGLTAALPDRYRTAVLSFSERGLCHPLLNAAGRLGAEGVELRHNAPAFGRAVAEVAGHLRRLNAAVLCCHGYKPDVLGLIAAKRVGIPVVAVAHGWTAATWKVRLNETLDRLAMRHMDRVVCVSEAQARQVLLAGVPASRTVVVPNAIAVERFEVPPDRAGRDRLRALFPEPPDLIVVAVGRLSPEKGFAVLVEAAAHIVKRRPRVGFLHFGAGPLRDPIARRLSRLGLARSFILGGFRGDLEAVLPYCDVLALPSFREGLPCVVLEAFAAGLPVVATAVGGTPEVVSDGLSGRLVPPGNAPALAGALLALLDDPACRARMSANGQALVRERHTFARQAESYEALFKALAPVPSADEAALSSA